MAKRIFNIEAESWDGLYAPGRPEARYAIFQRHAQQRIRRRLAMATRLLSPQPGARLLDIACGTGRIVEHLPPTVPSPVLLDSAITMLRIGRARHTVDGGTRSRWVGGDALALPFPDRSFDRALCLGLMNFFPRLQQEFLLREAFRVLAPGGRLVISSLRFDPVTYVRSRLYPTIPLPLSSPGPLFPTSRRAVVGLLTVAGFDVREVHSVSKYLGLPHYTLVLAAR